jgi:adenylyltransferase/sulfurtransferase
LSTDRYLRQVRFAPIGREGQERLGRARVLVIGLGALGSVSAELLARSGVGRLTLVDRDFLEESNLGRQTLYSPDDVREGLPKAVAAERRLRAVNPEIALEGRAADFNARNALELVSDADLVVDGLDNFEGRYLLNDACLEARVPWLHGACVGAYGLALDVLPFDGPCLRCFFETPPPPELSPTCETAGIIAPAAHLVASLQAAEALKLLTGHPDALNRKLVSFDLWEGWHREIDASPRARRADCPACGDAARRDFLRGRRESTAAALCGRDAVQVLPAQDTTVDLPALAARLGPATGAEVNPHLLRFSAEGIAFTVFRDGRAILRGLTDPARGRSLYARYVGG